VMELADLVVINKADLDEAAATRARAQISSSLRIIGLHHRDDHQHHNDSQWQPQVMQLSALKGSGLTEFWAAITRFQTLQRAGGRFTARRQQQDQAWMWERIDAGLKQRFKAHGPVREALPALTESVLAGHVAASVAARRLLDLFQ